MKKQLFLVSIDTEAPAGSDAVSNMIYCRTDKGEYGINHIMDILDSYDIKGLFFVDIAEAWHYGTDKIKGVLLDIDKRGHDIGVHVHPDHMSDENRRYLWQYSYEEQYQIIKKCTDFYKTVLGREPLSFRAGRYGANNDTIRVLSELGYKYDMSMYYGMKKRCKLDGDCETTNLVKALPGGVVEVPVTVFKSFDLFGYKRFDKLDESMPFGEFTRIVDEMIETDTVTVGSFFMHSFSFIEWRKNPDKPIYNINNNNRIVKMLEYIKASSNCCFIDESELFDLKNEKDAGVLDTSREWYSIYYSFLRARKIVKEKLVRNI